MLLKYDFQKKKRWKADFISFLVAILFHDAGSYCPVFFGFLDRTSIKGPFPVKSLCTWMIALLS
jgi:hypothetical protein